MDNVLAANDAWAAENRRVLAQKHTIMFNIIGSPGSGKTTFLEKTIDLLKGRVSIGVIEGDLATTKDARRIQKKKIPVVQINTGTACHLDAHTVNSALQALYKKDRLIELVFVENIGNLVCPAEFDIGEHAKIAILSVTEGDDKIEKYPLLFSQAKAILISKIDLIRYTDFNVSGALRAYRRINPGKKSLLIDSLSGKGFPDWIEYLSFFLKKHSFRR